MGDTYTSGYGKDDEDLIIVKVSRDTAKPLQVKVSMSWSAYDERLDIYADSGEDLILEWPTEVQARHFYNLFDSAEKRFD